MEWTQQMQRAIDYMEAHLMEEIRFEDVAKHVCISSTFFLSSYHLATILFISIHRQIQVFRAGAKMPKASP